VQTISEVEAEGRLSDILKKMAGGGEPITITLNGQGAAVILAANEYSSIQETLHLLSSPANAERIRRSLEDFAQGKLQAGELCD
jgi:antitoxin YefM